MSIAHLGVDALEGKNALKSYKGVLIQCGSKKLRFNTGNFPDDFMSATIAVMQGDYERCMLSSSVDHFTMDSKAFVWHENACFGEYPVAKANGKNKWDKFSVQIPNKKERRDVYILSDGAVAVSNRGHGRYKILTPDGHQDHTFDSVEEVLKFAEQLKRKVTWEA